MRVLILGGTVFLGVAVTEALLARGHEVTHFNRGRSGESPAAVRTVRGDRTTGFAGLEGERFDAVVDTSGYLPADVDRSAAFFSTRAQRYVFVSTVSVYDAAIDRIVEGSPMLRLPAGAPETAITAETYGPLKAACERILTERFAAGATIVRPGLIVGPRDPTGRFTYWPLRLDRGGDVLAPGDSQRAIQFIDVFDLAAFVADTIENPMPGDFNVVSEPGRFTMGQLLETCAQSSGTPSRLRWIRDERLLELGVTPWSDLPLWLPPDDETRGFYNVDVSKALANGLRVRPLGDTVRATLAWARLRSSHKSAGIAPERERTLLEQTA